jgi:hypothetical protein
MRIEHFGGTAVASDWPSLRQLLTLRYGSGANEFWLSGEERFPSLSILVRDERACLHFFRSEHDAGRCSQNDANGQEASGSLIFFTNTPDEEIEVPAEATVSFSTAMDAARDFLGSSEPPPSIHWKEL